MKLVETTKLKKYANDEFFASILNELDSVLGKKKSNTTEHIDIIFIHGRKDREYLINNILTFNKINRQNKCESLEEYYNIFWGDVEGPIKYKAYCDNLSNVHKGQFANGRKVCPFKMVQDYINDGMSKESAEAKVAARKKKAKEESAKVRRDRHDVSPCQLGYWLAKGYSEDEAKIKVSERQKTFTLEKCIEKYGLEEGTKHWQARQDKWQKTLNEKSEDEKREINKKKANYTRPNYDSCKEATLLNYLESEFNIQIERQYIIYLENVESHRSFDGRCGKLLIEFNGDYWHCNPAKFSADYYNEAMSKSAADIWEYDLQKKIGAENIGYKVFTVWESELDNMELIKERFANVIK